MAKQHFFKPLLPGFHSHLTIPVAFFLKNIEGRDEQKTAELRSDASKITWEVKIDGQRLTDGWKEFALSHDLRIGDIVVFRQERDMCFHVTMLGPSCCEIQYGKNNLGKIQRKTNPRRETESSSLDPSCFVANVTVSSLRDDRLNLPRSFVRENGLDTRCGEIVLMNEKGRTWTLDLKGNKSYGTTYIKRGWRSFCHANGLRAGSIFTFILIQKGKTPVLRLFSKEPEEQANEASLSPELESNEDSNLGKIQRRKNPSRDMESSSLDPSCFVANITRSSLRYDILYLPKRFMRANGLDTRCGEMILMNEKGRSWALDLKRKNSCGTTYIKRGWRSFCRANGLRAGSSYTFKLIQNGRTLVLRLVPKEPEEEEKANVESLSTEPSDEESSQDEKSSQECSKTMEKKSILIQKASSSASQSRFVTVTLTLYNVTLSRLTLPIPFTKVNGIQNAKKMSFLDKHGVKWSTSLTFEQDRQRMRLVGGWKEFCDANGVKIGESIMLELVLEADKSFVLKFCSKVMQEIK
ncbi:B3 DNA binding domain [Arabidopsis thaliana x Arabidopsis arenosa]|uniref:B3 DNA binding domain n=1 Tax=Arabidopsis thaliana x Arabidopsis arenosa TaxID=1240361 RepID=A0A8T2A276_9BRAS|nr:B3 DNA binding domain [Arabidopsis thaliana x Arabidopsis arenosa]